MTVKTVSQYGLAMAPEERIYRRIEADLRRQIADGTLPPGAKLPPEKALAEQWGTSRPTVRQALAPLEVEGLIDRRPPFGTFVRRRPALDTQHVIRDRAVYRDERGYYFDPAAVDWVALVPPSLSRGPAPADIARILRLPDANAEVVIRDRRMGPAGGEVLQIATSYIPADLAHGTVLEAINSGPGGIFDRMEQDMGLHLSWEDLYGARMPTGDEAAILGIPAGVPVFRIICVTRDESGRIVEVNDRRMSAEWFMVARPLARAAEA